MRIVFLALLIAITFQGISQNKKYDVECGGKYEGVFDKNREWHDYMIKLDGGDNLKVNAFSKFGDKLKLGIQIWSPAGIDLVPFNYGHHQVEAETGVVPGAGEFKVVPYNYHTNSYGATGHIGDYVIEFECMDINGNPKPGEAARYETTGVDKPIEQRRPERPKIVRPTISDNPSDFFDQPSPTAPLLSEAELSALPMADLGNALEGEIQAGENQLFGFKMEIPANTTASLDFAITTGKVPLEIKVINPSDQSTVFATTLGNAKSVQSKIDFDTRQTYIVFVREDMDQRKASGSTEFLIRLR